MAKPVVDGLEQKTEGRMIVSHVDVNSDEGSELAMKYRVRGVPSFVLLAPDGRVLWQQTGGKPDVAAVEKAISQ